jgi:hypothetical protein
VKLCAMSGFQRWSWMALLVLVFVLVMVQLSGDRADWRLFEPASR